MTPQSSSSSRLGKCTKLREALSTIVADLRETTFYQVEIKSVLDKGSEKLANRQIEQIVCYGLGTFRYGVDVASRYQLALLILIHEHLVEHGSPLKSPIEVYDPSFKQLDRDTLLSFKVPKFKIIEENEFCARSLSTSCDNRCILMYMPHLDKYLYNNLLGANWSVNQLTRLVVLGNSFTEMIDNEPSAKCRSELHYLNSLVSNFSDPIKPSRKHSQSNKKFKTESPNKSGAPRLRALVELEIDDKLFNHSDIFNSLSLHFIDGEWLCSSNGPTTIMKYRLSNWSCVTSICQSDANESDGWFSK